MQKAVGFLLSPPHLSADPGIPSISDFKTVPKQSFTHIGALYAEFWDNDYMTGEWYSPVRFAGLYGRTWAGAHSKKTPVKVSFALLHMEQLTLLKTLSLTRD
ncbi:hypothetical protein [Paenibacillus ihuae]|uniref:hypothetical protein n=1 Tax=Paenibacillus ihuae TaxID=1232431 RepID=UPI001AE0774A|nr:hypothetical protein [Paenibacillus ihuae]